MWPRRASRSVFVGLDLSPGRIKLVALAAGPAGTVVACAADEGFGADGAGGRTPFDAAATGARVAALLGRHRLRPRAVALALGPADAVTRRLPAPAGSPQEVRAALARQLRQALGADVAAPRVAHLPLGAATDGSPAPLLAAAARREAVAAQLRALAAAGIPPGPVTTAAAALLHAWRALTPEDAPPGRSVLLHVGHSAALWIVVDDGEPVALDAPLVGVASLGGAGASGVPARAALDAWAARLRQEIARGVQPLRRAGGAAALYTVWVSGGGLAIPGFLEALRAALPVPVHAFDPLRELAWEDGAGDAFAPALVLALGAALQAHAAEHGGGPLPALDLRDPSDLRAPGAPRLPLPVIVRAVARDAGFRALAVTVVVLAGAAAALEARMAAGERRVAAAEARVAAEAAALAAVTDRARAEEARLSDATEGAAAAAAVEELRYAWPRLLRAVAAALPAAAWVSDVVPGDDEGAGAVSARVRGFAASDGVAAAFARGLLRAGAAEAEVVRTAAVTVGRETVVQFEVTVRMPAEAPADSASAGGAR
jgi:Tfp pilus assembly PilM family ATPase